jgi:hypothetical protein
MVKVLDTLLLQKVTAPPKDMELLEASITASVMELEASSVVLPFIAGRLLSKVSEPPEPYIQFMVLAPPAALEAVIPHRRLPVPESLLL